MSKIINGKYILGIDTGNSDTKTSNGIKVNSGFTSTRYLPLPSKHVINYNEVYHIIGNRRFSVMEDKTLNDNFKILSLGAIAASMDKDGISEADVVLGVGLPIIHYGKQKSAFEQYFKGKYEFTYNDIPFFITIEKAYAYPQGFVCIGNFDSRQDYPIFNLCDIGGGTLDVCIVKDGIDPVKPTSFDIGVVALINDIKNTLFGMCYKCDEAHIQGIITEKYKEKNQNLIDVCNQYVEDFSQKIAGTLSDYGMDLNINPTLFIGGGAKLIEKHIKKLFPENDLFTFLDEFANANAYEAFTADRIERGI